MKDILHMVLTEFWPFVAALILIYAIGEVMTWIVAAIVGVRRHK